MTLTMRDASASVETAQGEMTGGSVCQPVAQTADARPLESGENPSLNMTAAEIDDARRYRLTERQQAILDFIRTSIRQTGRPPTLREIGRQFQIRSTNGVNDHLLAIQRKGALLKDPMVSRGLIPVTRIGEAPQPEETPDVVGAMQAEIGALRELLRRCLHAGRRLPTLSAEMVVVLGDVRDVLAGRVR